LKKLTSSPKDFFCPALDLPSSDEKQPYIQAQVLHTKADEREREREREKSFFVLPQKKFKKKE